MRSNHFARLLLPCAAALGLIVIITAGVSAGMRFPHPKHQEAGLECDVCHPGATSSKSGEDRLAPTRTICLDCHTEEDLTTYGWSEPAASTSGFPKFSHEKHLAMDGVDCARCHGALADPLMAGTGKGEIGHDVCFVCHDGRKAPNDCESCHRNIHTLRPRNHDVDYLHTHQFLARGNAEACEECHRQSEQCSECHQGENILFPTHDRNYLFTHPIDARKQSYDCTTCHDIESFCNDCHAQEGIRPANHTSNWIGGLNKHAAEARRDITYCAACHEGDDPVCVACHQDKTPGRGNDRSIHPSGFNNYETHGPWHDDDGYYCFDCHTKGNDFCTYCHEPRTGD